jgi:hypothetical protein
MNYQQKQQERHEKMDYRQPHYKPGRNRRRASYAISKAHSALYRKHTKPTKHFWITHINHHRATKKGKRGKGRKIRYRTPISNFRAHLSSSNAAYLDQTWRKGRKIKRGIQEAIAFYVFRCRWRERRRWTGFLLYVSHECCCFCLQENNRRCLRAYVFGLDWTCIIKATFNPMEIDFFFFCSNWRERKNYPLNLKLTIESALEKNFKNIKEKLFRILFFWMKDLNWVWSWVQDLVTKISISCLDKFIAKLNEERRPCSTRETMK